MPLMLNYNLEESEEDMFGIYVRAAMRNFVRRKGYFMLMVIGLSVGLTCCLLILAYILDELAYDGFHEKADRIYRVVSDIETPQGTLQKLSANGWPVGRILASEYPEVEAVTYVRSWPSFPIKHDGRFFYEKMIWADSTFFQIFSFPLLRGDPNTALRDPYTVVITEEMAKKYFGGVEEAFGKPLFIIENYQFIVTGITRVPQHSHIAFDVILSLPTYCRFYPDYCRVSYEQGWFNLNMYNYVLLRDAADPTSFAKKIQDLPIRRDPEYIRQIGAKISLQLWPLKDVYLHFDRENGLGPLGNINRTYLLMAIALFILALSCINFINLTTARSLERAKSIGMRKVLGSSRREIVLGFLLESFFTFLLALVLAIELVWFVLPLFNDLTSKQLTYSDFFSPPAVFGSIALLLATASLAGCYPSFVISKFEPSEALRGSYSRTPQGVFVRKALVIFQFIVSSVLIIFTIVVYSQLQFMQNQPVGFDKENVIVINVHRFPRQTLTAQYETIKDEIRKHPSVKGVTGTNAVPGRPGWMGQFAYPEGRPKEQSVTLDYVVADPDYVPLFGLQLMAGRNFFTSSKSDIDRGVMINEAALKLIGWKTAEEAIGKSLPSPGSDKPIGEIIGVIKDYFHHSLREQVRPMMFGMNPGRLDYFAIKLEVKDMESVLTHLQNLWASFFPGYPFNYFLLEEDYDLQYRDERRLGMMFAIFSLVSILVASLGLVGLATFSAEQKTKEIAVRKAFGAPIPSIVQIFLRDVVKLVLVALAISLPLGYYFMNRWLEAFPYQIGGRWWILLLVHSHLLLLP